MNNKKYINKKLLSVADKQNKQLKKAGQLVVEVICLYVLVCILNFKTMKNNLFPQNDTEAKIGVNYA